MPEDLKPAPAPAPTMSPPKAVEPEVVPEGQHIFHAAKLEPMAKKWQELNTTDAAAAMALLEQIIIMSTPMFERLAMHEEFHLTVPLDQLISAAQEKVVVWLLRWDPNKGRLFSWFSKCAKNAFRAEITKVLNFRDHIHTTDDSLEKLFGSEDHEVDKHDAAEDVRRRIHGITCRWGHPQELGTLHYLIECIIDDNHQKEMAIQGAAFAWGLSVDHVRFFYTWCLMALRNAHLDKVSIPLTEQDLFRCRYAYTVLPDWLNIIPWDKVQHTCHHCGRTSLCSSGSFKDVIATFGGMRIKFPSIDELIRLRDDYHISREISKSDMDPESVGAIMKKHKRPARTAEQIYRELTQLNDKNLLGEHYIYDEHHH
jgi:hypothetical protein